jgi:hypothetical protein
MLSGFAQPVAGRRIGLGILKFRRKYKKYLKIPVASISKEFVSSLPQSRSPALSIKLVGLTGFRQNRVIRPKLASISYTACFQIFKTGV